jgi:hypothetical protein
MPSVLSPCLEEESGSVNMPASWGQLSRRNNAYPQGLSCTPTHSCELSCESQQETELTGSLSFFSSFLLPSFLPSFLPFPPPFLLLVKSGARTQGLTLAGQVLYHLSHTPIPKRLSLQNPNYEGCWQPKPELPIVCYDNRKETAVTVGVEIRNRFCLGQRTELLGTFWNLLTKQYPESRARRKKN